MGRYSAELRNQDGFSIIVLKDSASDSIAKLIPAVGNNLFSFQQGGHEVIRTPISLQTLQNETFACSKYGTPILFPPNRVRNGTYSFNGRTYQLPINEPPHFHLHGELISRGWHLVEFGALDGIGAWAKSRFSFSEHPDMMDYYPHAISFTITYRLLDGKLHMESSIVNEGADEAPFAYGLHPYFSVPYESGNNVMLQVPAKDEWPVTNQAFVIEQPSVTGLSLSIRDGIDLVNYPVLGCSLLTMDQAAKPICRIAIPQRGYTIAYQLDDSFPYVLLFRPDWDDAFSIEPYTYVTDAFNLPYPSERTGAQGIRPGEERRLTTTLWTEQSNLKIEEDRIMQQSTDSNNSNTSNSNSGIAEKLGIDFSTVIKPEMPQRKDYRIGCIGSGFIMRDCHLVAYRDAGFNPVAIASRTYDNAKEVAELRGIPKVHRTWEELVRDPEIEILDIAFPPDRQLEVVREAVKQPHIRGILCQKPLAMNSREAREIVDLCEAAGIKVAVNSNMRYDQSIRALKAILDRGLLGQPVLATIEMRAIPHWQAFLQQYDQIEILNMGIHHIDSFRYLFGDPEKVTAVARRDPRTQFPHIDGISQYTFQYASELMATSLDDVWAWPGEGTEKDIYIKWRVEGLDGMATGTIGWPTYPERTPSTLAFTTRQASGEWHRPQWDSVWFPDAFQGTMAQLLRAVESGSEPEIGGRDNLRTMAAIDACYKSIAEGRTVQFKEVL